MPLELHHLVDGFAEVCQIEIVAIRAPSKAQFTQDVQADGHKMQAHVSSPRDVRSRHRVLKIDEDVLVHDRLTENLWIYRSHHRQDLTRQVGDPGRRGCLVSSCARAYLQDHEDD